MSPKPKFYVFLLGKSPPKLSLGIIIYINFCKLTQITKKVDNFRQGGLRCDLKLN